MNHHNNVGSIDLNPFEIIEKKKLMRAKFIIQTNQISLPACHNMGTHMNITGMSQDSQTAYQICISNLERTRSVTYLAVLKECEL